MIIVKLIELTDQLTLLERIERLEKIIESGNIKVSPRNEVAKAVKEKSAKKVKEKVIEKPKKEESEPIIVDDGKELSFDYIKSQWSKVLQNVKKQRVGIQALLMEGNLLNSKTGILTIGFSENYGIHKQAISKKENKEFVEQVVSSYFNKNIRIKFVMFSEEEKKSEEDEEEKMIKEAVDFFGKDLVNIKK